jgi:hypothetical protein
MTAAPGAGGPESPGPTPSRSFYQDKAKFDFEVDLIFLHHRIFVSCEPEQGNDVTVGFGNAPIVVLCDDDGGCAPSVHVAGAESSFRDQAPYHRPCKSEGASIIAAGITWL